MIKYLGFDFFFDIDTIRLLIFSALLGNIFRLLLSVIHNQTWTRSRLQFLTFSFLPAITFIITKTIAGNIALSLGMVGALSIVRLRTPVKNPFELISYFFLITLGIITSVDPNLGVNFLITTIIISVIVELLNNNLKKIFKNQNFAFVDQQNTSNLIITTNSKIEDDDILQDLISSSFAEGEYQYSFESTDVEKLNSIVNSISSENIKSYYIENGSD
tara:strand:+ start:59 stop:709 length:651 start_codon:yes stop_codon:yes gene_type:complete